MKSEQSPETTGQSILERLGIAEDPLIGVDPVSFLRSLAAAGVALVKDPAAVTAAAAANARLAIGTAAAVRASAGRAVGSAMAGPMSPATGDKRFADPAYEDNPLYFLLAQQYLLNGQLVNELLDAAALDAKEDNKARFAAKFILDALSPTNTVLGNPAAIRAAFDTGGKSLARGAKNMLGDLLNNGGWPSQVDQLRVRGRRQHGRDTRRSGLPERLDRADPVQAAGQAGALRAAAVLPAVDQHSTTSWIWLPVRA